MEQIVATINQQIEYLSEMVVDFEITPRNIIPRVLKNILKFKITYIVVYYFALLFTTIVFNDIYPSIIATVFLMMAGMFLMKHSIAIKIDKYEFTFGLELFISTLFSLPFSISLMTDSFGHFLSSVIIALLPIIGHAICFIEGDKKKVKKESESSSEDDEKKKKE